MPGSSFGVGPIGSARRRKLLMSWSPTARAARQTANSPSGLSSVTLASKRSPAARPQSDLRTHRQALKAVLADREGEPAVAGDAKGQHRLARRDRFAALGDEKPRNPVDRRGQRRLGELSLKVGDRRQRKRDLALRDRKLFLRRSSLALGQSRLGKNETRLRLAQCRGVLVILLPARVVLRRQHRDARELLLRQRDVGVRRSRRSAPPCRALPDARPL